MTQQRNKTPVGFLIKNMSIRILAERRQDDKFMKICQNCYVAVDIRYHECEKKRKNEKLIDGKKKMV